jgi:hypothetical protein
MPDGAKVYSVERQNELFKQTWFVRKLGIRPKHLSLGMVIRPTSCSLLALSLLQGTIYTTTAYGTIKNRR